MNEIIEDCKEKGYSKALTDFLIDFLKKVPKAYLKRATEAIKSAKICLVDSNDNFNKLISDTAINEFGYELTDEGYITTCKDGAYIPIIDFPNLSIRRTVVVKVNNINYLDASDKQKILHQLFHLFRSYSGKKLSSDKDNIIVHSGVMITKVPLDNKIDYKHSVKENYQCEENFVDYLVNYFDILIDFGNIDVNLLKAYNELISGKKFYIYIQEKRVELLLLYLSLLVVNGIYQGDIMNSLFSDDVDFLRRIEEISGKDKREMFSKIYSSLKNDDSMIDEIRNFAI